MKNYQRFVVYIICFITHVTLWAILGSWLESNEIIVSPAYWALYGSVFTFGSILFLYMLHARILPSKRKSPSIARELAAAQRQMHRANNSRLRDMKWRHDISSKYGDHNATVLYNLCVLISKYNPHPYSQYMHNAKCLLAQFTYNETLDFLIKELHKKGE